MRVWAITALLLTAVGATAVAIGTVWVATDLSLPTSVRFLAWSSLIAAGGYLMMAAVDR